MSTDILKKQHGYDREHYAANREKYAARARKWRLANPEKAKAVNRKWQAANLETTRSKNRERNRKLCGSPTPTRPMPELCERGCGRKAKCLDHCHTTKVFRGWLCAPCNMGIGLLGDTLGDLRAGVDYLQRAMSWL